MARTVEPAAVEPAAVEPAAVEPATAGKSTDVDAVVEAILPSVPKSTGVEVLTSVNRFGCILSGVDVALANGTVVTTDEFGHVTIPAGMEYTCNQTLIRSR